MTCVNYLEKLVVVLFAPMISPFFMNKWIEQSFDTACRGVKIKKVSSHFTCCKNFSLKLNTGFIQECKNILSGFEESSVNFVSRKFNSAAHKLSRHGMLRPKNQTWEIA